MAGKATSSKQASSRAPDALTDILGKSPLLLSTISLPADYFVAFVKLEAVNASQGHQDVELARRELVRRNDSRSLLDGTFPFVQLTKEQSILWVFCVENNGDTSRRLSGISFENLQVIERDRFQHQEIYPCSSTCSDRREPCLDCLNPPLPPQPPTPLPLYRERSPTDIKSSSRSTTPFPPPSDTRFNPPKAAACLLARKPLRLPLRFFLAAVKDRYIDHICEEAAKRKFEGRAVRAFRGGFLLGPSTCNSDWGDEWDSSRRSRPLSHCTTSLVLHRRDILISYKFSLTYLSPILSCTPLPPGSPLYLLPFSTPAYFVNTYSGPCGALIKQFEPYLAGLGAGQWSSGHQGVNPTNTPEFVIVWVKIQTSPDGDLDEKGFFAIWPSRLCVSVLPVPSRHGEKEFAYRREMQRPLPELPPALQPSPVPSAATVHTKPPPPQLSPTSPTPVELPMQSPTSRSPNPSKGSPKRSHRPSFSRARSPLTSHYLHSFRKHNLRRSRSLREIRDVAQNVGKFVDSIAKEREKERERIRRERDAAQQAAKQAGDSSATHDTAVVDTPQQQQTPMDITVESPGAPVNTNHPTHEVPTSHPAYPSPPDEPSVPAIVPKVEDGLQPPFPDHEPQNPAQSATTSANFTSFETLDDSWMNADFKFMKDFGMDFDMDVGMGSSNAAQEIMSGDQMKLDLDSFVLTDDDFSFFDVQPATNNFSTSTTLVENNILSTFDAPEAHVPSLNVSTALSAHVETPMEPWMASRASGVFASPTVSVFSHHNPIDTPAPDLVPASPSKSFTTQSGPATPNVAFLTESYLNAQTHSAIYGLDQFDPLQFAPRHSLVDAKYTNGKFQLPSPSTSSSSSRSDYMSGTEQSGWQASYTLMTNPKVATVRKLIDMKARKGQVSVTPIAPTSVLSVTGSGDWIDIDGLDDIDEDDRSDSDDESDFEGSAFDVDEPALDHSRPSTPLPSYLPPGASLLATRFTHERLVPFSQKLPIPVPSFDEDDMDMEVQLVPTPVSPSAVATSPKDEMKRYLSLLRLLCDELLDNPVWGNAWRASLVEQSQNNNRWFTDDGAWFDDVRFAITCCHAVPSTRTPTNIAQFIQTVAASSDDVLDLQDAVSHVEPTKVVVGKSDSLIQISPPALRFWDKLGLSPRSGKKDITAFVVHNEQHDITDDAASWLVDLSRLYTARGYGDHSPGLISACKEDGILVIHFDNFRTNMLNILQSAELPSGPLVFYVMTTVSMLSTLSPALRQLLTGVKHIISNNPDGRLYFHLIPDHACKPSDCHYSKEMQEDIVHSVYDRIRRPTYKMLSRQLHSDKNALSKKFKAPAFTLARPSRGSISLDFKNPDRISSVSDRHMLLHVAFCVTENNRWLVCMCLDGRGEMQELGIWKNGDEKANASNLWDFALKFAGQANIEWRIAFAKFGPITERELEAWNVRAVNYLTKEVEHAELHASLVSFEDETCLIDDIEAGEVLSNYKIASEASRGSLLAPRDTTFLLSHVRCSMFSSSGLRRFEWGDVRQDDTEGPLYDHEVPLRPLHSSILINYRGGNNQPSHFQARYLHLLSSVSSARSTLHKTDQENLLDISQSYCDLASLQSMRQREGSSSPPLPPHLATIALVRSILDLSA